jgi:probable F420-dependent oxidoreductase
VDLGTVGIWTPSYQWRGEDPGGIAAELEALGFGTLWLGRADGTTMRPVRELLAATDRLVVATGIVSIWQHPAERVTAAWHDVTAAHPDRLLLGLGVSHAAPVEATTPYRYVRPYARMVEYLDALDAAEEPVPTERRALAALGPRMLRLAAARTAGAHPYLVTPEHTAEARAIMGPRALLAPEQTVVLETDPAAARAIARRTLGFYLGAPNYVHSFARQGFGGDDLVGGGSDRLVDAMVAWGDLDTIAKRLRAHHDAGANHVAVQVVPADSDPGAGVGHLPRDEWRLVAAALRA